MNMLISPTYSSKSLKNEIAEPFHGQAGWRRGAGDSPQEFIFCSPRPEEIKERQRWVSDWKNGWLLIGEYVAQRNRLRLRRQQFYIANPHLIQERIRVKRQKRAEDADALLDRRISA